MACRRQAPSHYLNQCWNIVNSTRTNLGRNFIETHIFSFKKMYSKMSFTKWRRFVRQRSVLFTKQSTWGGPLELIQSACLNVIYTCQRALWRSRLGWIYRSHIYHFITIKVMASCLFTAVINYVCIYGYTYVYICMPTTLYICRIMSPTYLGRGQWAIFSLHVIIWNAFRSNVPLRVDIQVNAGFSRPSFRNYLPIICWSSVSKPYLHL